MQKKVLKPLLALPLIALFTGAWTFEIIDKPGNEHVIRGMQARDISDHVTAIAEFEKAIERSIDYQTKGRSMTQIASIYLSQEPLAAQRAQEAIALLEQAEKLGYSRSLLVLGSVYQEGKGVPPDATKAYDYFTQVQDRYAGALVSLAELMVDPELARDYMASAATKLESELTPSNEVTLRMARHFRDGIVVTANQPLAEYWYGRAVQAGSAPAMMELAKMWMETNHQPSSDVASLWESAAALGNARAALELGFAYALGQNVEQDGEKSRRYFSQAVEADPANAYRIARWYEEKGKMDEVYNEVAFNWYRVAASKGNPDAIIRQARMYWAGERVVMDRVRARSLYQQAASLGSEKALPELAEREIRVQMQAEQRAMKLVEQERKRTDKKQARLARDRLAMRKKVGGITFWKPLADSGDTEAMLRVGEAYIQGNGVEANTATGIEWMHKSAARSNGEAMYALAQIHSTGLGVPMDLTKAYEWYEKSANAGYAAGQYQLGLGYARGIGVDKDAEKARNWLNKANKNGYSRATAILNTLTNP
ncbi:MAG: tetratricopeptide repeat protein [Rickettsiales bacterium]|nr:tetratricopeptide repeat protein [Rickettsiales bacterium]